MAIVRAQEASSSTCVYAYDVFLSFRGEDTRKNFTDHLYTALVQAGYRTFRDDDEIERGESLKPELDKAIKESRISIIVFSKDYASSRWCLDELVLILKCRSTSGHVVLPVFYDICPSEIWKQTGRTREAFDGYVQQYEAETDTVVKMKLTEKVKGWKEALEEVADFAGMELRNQADGHESKFIEQIIKVVGDKLSRVILDVGPYEIGIHSRARKINLWLQDGSTRVGALGICGMGGIGKTTIAKYVFNQNHKRFDGSSFLANIREMSAQPSGLVGLQKQLLSDVLKSKEEGISNVYEGITKIKHALSRKRVLLVFDDADQIDQLYAVHGLQDHLFPGSKIIITTRNENLLKPHEVYRVKELDYHESVTLFSLHAFGKECPPESYKKQTKRVIQLCGGLPLALQVLGSSLSRKSVDRWVNEVKKLEAIPHYKILEKLKISYDSLEDDDDKRLFLHIACFFVGEDKDEIVKILYSDLHAAVGIENLTDRCLLTIDFDNKLRMHQLIRDMGRKIVYQESPEEPGERSRLWLPEHSFNVLKNRTGTKKIEGLTLDMHLLKDDVTKLKNRKYEELEKSTLSNKVTSLKRHCFSLLSGQSIGNTSTSPNEVELSTYAFQEMKNLRLLKLNHVHLSGSYECFSKNLSWLCWHGFPLKLVPTELSLENLVVLDMSYSKLKQVWKGFKLLASLKILNLSYSQRLKRTPNFLGSRCLERLILIGCVSLVDISESIECLGELVLLDLKNCKSLRKLPRNIHMLRSLETLIISGCSNLVEFPTNMRNMPSLQVLRADEMAINALSMTSMQDKSWHAVFMSLVSRPRISRATFVTSLPVTLVELSLVRCRLYEDSCPSAFNNLTLLKKLDISENFFGTLPDWVKSLSNLELLKIRSCELLQSILGLPCSLEKVKMDFCSAVKKLSFQSTQTRIAHIGTWFCNDLLEIEGLFKVQPLGKVDARIIKSLGVDIESMENISVLFTDFYNTRMRPIQGLHEFGIFSTFIPGGMVPSCFSDKSKGSSISFTVPSLLNLRIRCLNVLSVYYNRKLLFSPDPERGLLINIHNRTKDLTWIYNPVCFGYPDRDGGDMAWLSQWNFGNQLEGGDEVTISISSDRNFGVKECGISIVYEDEEEEEEEKNEEQNENQHNSTYFFWNEVIGGDLSNFQLSTGAYFLCRRIFRENHLHDYALRESLKEIIDVEELKKLKVRCALPVEVIP